MIFSIRPEGPQPIYEQIVAQVIYGVAAGTLEAGTFIPSVRDLAEQLLVHPNTVARAFQELERTGVVTPRRGRGMEVTPEAPKACKSLRNDLVRGRIRQALREAAASALGADDIRIMVEEELAAVNGKRRK
jgi:GntR family transcriptional regulator